MSKFVESLEGRRLLATVTWDGGGANNNFATPENWSGDQLPTSADDVIVSGSTGGVPTLNAGTPITYKSLTIARMVYLANTNSTINIVGDLHVLAGGNAVFPTGTITGTGKVIVDVGGQFRPDFATGAIGGNLRMPADNYGTFGLAGGKEFATELHNYGTVTAYESGDCYGILYNEPGGIIESRYLPNSPSNVSLGLKRSPEGVVSPGLFVNHGTVYSGVKAGATGLSQALTIYVDGSPTLTGTWKSTSPDAPLRFKSFSATPATVNVDATFSFLGGELQLDGVNGTLRGIADGSILTTTASPTTTLTLAQTRTSLSILNMFAGRLTLPGGGDRVLRVDDLRLGFAARLDVADNLLIHGNKPTYLYPQVTPLPAPASLPAFTDSIRGNVNGQILTVNTGVDPAASTSRAVGFSNGAGLASFYPSHTFRGEAFDNDDFVFFPTLRGDANFDRTVDFNDLVSLSQHYGTTTSRGFADGNFDSPASNSAVDFNDLVLLAQNYGVSFSVAPILAPSKATVGTKPRGNAKDVLM